MQEILENGEFILLENGEEKKYNTLFTFKCLENNKDYVVYTDNTTDEEGNLNVFTSVYNPEAERFELLPVETDEEWQMIDDKIDEEFSKFIEIEGEKNE